MEESIGKPNTKKTKIKMYRSKETLQQAPLNKRKESYGPGPTERKDKTGIAGVLRRNSPNISPEGQDIKRGGLPCNRRTTEFRNIQGGSAIPWNTRTITSCDSRVSCEAGQEGEGSHAARRGTQQRGCQPQPIDQGPNRGNYHFFNVVPCCRRESVTTGKDPG